MRPNQASAPLGGLLHSAVPVHRPRVIRILGIVILVGFVQSFSSSSLAIAQSPSDAQRTPAIASSQDRTQPASVQPTTLPDVPQFVPQPADGSGLRPSLPTEAWMGNSVKQPQANSPTTPTSPTASETKVRHRLPAADAGATPGSSDTSGSTGGVLRPLISIGSSLLIVLGAFFALVWVYRKSSNGAMQTLPKQVVQVLGRTQLSPRQNLILLRFGSKLVLVSLAPGETRTIGEIADPLEVDQLAGLCESSSPNSLSNSFKSILSQGGA